MDKPPRTQEPILGDALEMMKQTGLHFEVLEKHARRGGGADTNLCLRHAGRRIQYAAEVRHRLRPENLGVVVHQLRARAKHPLLVTTYVTPPLADALRAQGIEFIDAAGNAFLNQPPLWVFIKGQRRKGHEAGDGHGRTFKAAGLRVLFALLARPVLVARPYREIAAAAGVARGTVGWVMAELPNLGYLAHVGGRRRLVNAERLLGQWTEAYARTLRPTLLLAEFRGDIDRLNATKTGGKTGLLLGGEMAAARLTHHLRPGTATFYAHAIDPKVVLRLGLRADRGGNVNFRRRFWTFPGEDPRLVPTLLVYADLLAIGGARCLETAELLREQLLAGFV